MSPRIAVAAAVLALAASPSSAQEGGGAAPARHVNKVTDAAKAAFERMEKAMYSPVAAGLKDLSGTMELKMEGMGMGGPGGPGGPGGRGGGRGGPGGPGGMGGMSFAYSVSFKAPADLKVESKSEGQGFMGAMGANMKRIPETLLKVSLGLLKPTDAEEYDADATTEGGKTVVTIVRYENGTETNRNSMTLDDRGLIETMTSTSKAPADAPPSGPGGGMRGGRGGAPGMGGDQASTAKYTWRKEGDRWLIEKMETKSGERGGSITPNYLDAGGYKLMSSWTMAAESQRMGNATFGFRFTDLSVNGKKVEVPAETAGKPGEPGAPGGDGGTGGEGGMGGEGGK